MVGVAMGGPSAVYVLAPITILSLSHITRSIQNHASRGHLALSSSIVLLLASGICLFLGPHASKLLESHTRLRKRRNKHSKPRSAGRDNDAASGKVQKGEGSDQPGKYTVSVLVTCIALRCAVSERLHHQEQCKAYNYEPYLSVLILLYEAYEEGHWFSDVSPSDADDPWRSTLDDIYDWFSGPRPLLVAMVLALLVLAQGASLASAPGMRSSYLCSRAFAGNSTTLPLQLLGVLLNAVIVWTFWHLLSQARTLENHTRSLSRVLLLTATATSVLWCISWIFGWESSTGSLGGSFIGFDIVLDAIVFSALAISFTIWCCESTPLLPIVVLTMLFGFYQSAGHVLQSGQWDHLSRPDILWPIGLLSGGALAFVLTRDGQQKVVSRRFPFAILLLCFSTFCFIFVSVRSADVFPHHPLSDLIYKARVEHDRWLKKVSISQSVPVAIRIYVERHNLRQPPPFFQQWYERAQKRPVLDDFRQMDRDLAPFWNLPPRVIRERAVLASLLGGVATITVSGSKVSHAGTTSEEERLQMDQVVAMVSKYGEYLPDMVLPINLDSDPRVLPSWNEIQSNARTDLNSIVESVQSGKTNILDHSTSIFGKGPLWEQYQAACPSNTRGTSSPRPSKKDFCTDCIRRHSKGPILTKWDSSLEICQQPDIYDLHAFFLADTSTKSVKRLLPLFSAAKLDGFKDILFPLPSTISGQPQGELAFDKREDTLFWEGRSPNRAVSPQALQGYQDFRLMDLARSPANHDDVVVVLPRPKPSSDQGGGGKKRPKGPTYAYERVSAVEAQKAASLNFGMPVVAADGCSGSSCTTALTTLARLEGSSQEAFEHRYVLLTDTDGSPPLRMMETLRSGSVPFISTSFRTWYTERLHPWLHFVPVDLRLQSLHSTLLYFTGSSSGIVSNGRNVTFPGSLKDGRWIASQGAKWTKQAIEQVDLEVYLFRLLLEWGRLINDDRDRIGVWQDENGVLHDTGWVTHEA